MKTVFVVDDERLIADTLSIIIRGAGYTTRAFHSAVELLEHLDDETPDLVISDVVMPEINGIQLALHLRKIKGGIRTLLLSGQAQTSILLEQARREGHDLEVLTKPINPARLLVHVRELLGSRSDKDCPLGT